ncbi:MAG: hypothetical protein CFE43_13695 [Burkholderiales bacterium PBB3]|nr:MAG: hypothetical protein CFE43_13695 [Burkholderiales bacterium PBB3]
MKNCTDCGAYASIFPIVLPCMSRQHQGFREDVKLVCYTGTMFIHRIFITGCSDRGAWPWRTLTVMDAAMV